MFLVFVVVVVLPDVDDGRVVLVIHEYSIIIDRHSTKIGYVKPNLLFNGELEWSFGLIVTIGWVSSETIGCPQ